MKLLTALIYFFTFTASFANDFLKMDEFVLRGEALLEVTLLKIDVYRAKLYHSNNDKKVLVLELNYLIDVEKKHSLMGWQEGFKPLDTDLYKNAMNWIYKNTIDLKKGDKFSIWKKENKVRFYHNQKLTAELEDPKVSFLVTYPWIGDKPIDEKIKKNLLGEK